MSVVDRFRGTSGREKFGVALVARSSSLSLHSSFRVLHIPTFRQDVASFLSSPLINPLSITEAARVALIAACLAATLHLVDDPAELSELGHSSEESRAREVKRLSDLMEMTFFRADWMQHHRIEWLQAFM